MAQIDIDKFVISLMRYFGNNKGIATTLDRCLFSLGLKYVDTPTGGRLERVDQPTMLENIMWGSGEKKSADKVEHKFKVGDWINGYYTNYKVISVNNKGYVVEDVDGDKINILFENEKFHRLWTIQDAKDGDILYTPKGLGVEGIFLVSGWQQIEGTGKTLCSNIGYRVDDDEIVEGGIGAIWWEGVKDPFFPATKEQRDTLFAKMKEADYEKKELKKIEQKPVECVEWNEEDINMIDWLIRCCEKEHKELCNDRYGHQDIVSDLKRDCRKKWDWLESLKNRVAPQSRWKPSDTDIKVLEDVIDRGRNPIDYHATLHVILEQLKKLREG